MAGNRLRVLVVDDEPSICQAMTISLTREGYDAISTESGDAALAIIRSQHVDMLLIDLRMREMRGDETFHLAAAIQPHLRNTTIFMTGDITEAAEQVIADCNCEFLRKPFDLTKMLAAVSKLTPRIRDATA